MGHGFSGPAYGAGAPPTCCLRRPHQNDTQKHQKSFKTQPRTVYLRNGFQVIDRQKSTIFDRFRASRVSHRDQRAISRRMVQFQPISRDGMKFWLKNSSTAAQRAFSFKNFDTRLRKEHGTGMILKPLCEREPAECGTPRICLQGSLKMTLSGKTTAAETGGQKPPSPLL